VTARQPVYAVPINAVKLSATVLVANETTNKQTRLVEGVKAM
jgi:hypothetical protein